VLPGRGPCDELIIRTEESYRLCCVWFRSLKNEKTTAVLWLQTDMKKKITNILYCLKYW